MHRNRRSACDRCRDQKLRCRRENGAIASCVRCARAEVACVTSSSKPVGRPVRGPLYDSSGHSRLRMSTNTHPSNYEQSLDVARPSNANQQKTLFSDMDMSSALDVSFPYHSSTISSRSESWDPMMSAMQMDGFDVGMSDLASFLEPLSGTDIIPDVLHQSKLQPTNPYPLTPQTENSTSLEESRDPFLLLSKLNRGLYEWTLAIQKDDCPRPYRLNMSCDSYDSHGHSHDSQGPINPTASFLRILSDFISALKLLASPDTSKEDGTINEKPDKASNLQNEGDGTNTPMNDASTNSARSSLGIPTMLMAMTTYLLFLRVYNLIISRICFVLETMPGGSANFQYDSDVQLGGLPIPQGLLQLKLVIQVLEHQLVLIETLLGLPAEYRVHTPARLSEGKRRLPSGLFSCESHRSLLKVVMGEGGQGDERPHSDVSSLRQNFAKLKDLLQESV